MTKNTRGWYRFEDGSEIWFNKLAGREKTVEIRKHGKITGFIPTK